MIDFCGEIGLIHLYSRKTLQCDRESVENLYETPGCVGFCLAYGVEIALLQGGQGALSTPCFQIKGEERRGDAASDRGETLRPLFGEGDRGDDFQGDS